MKTDTVRLEKSAEIGQSIDGINLALIVLEDLARLINGEPTENGIETKAYSPSVSELLSDGDKVLDNCRERIIAVTEKIRNATI